MITLNKFLVGTSGAVKVLHPAFGLVKFNNCHLNFQALKRTL